MLALIRKLWVGVFLILLCSIIILFTSVQKVGTVRRVAVLQPMSRKSLDQVYAGIVDRFASMGFHEGRNIHIQRFIAEGDMATLSTMANEIVQQKFDLAIAITTPSLQAMWRADARGDIPFVFTCIADPFTAIPALDRTRPDNHPPFMTGLSTRYDLRATLDYLRSMNPKVRRLGLVWNNAEDNSRIQRDDLVVLCKEKGFELLESTAENSSVVLDAVRSLMSRGAECFYISGDSTVLAAAESYIKEALENGLPTVTVTSESLKAGAMFTLGSNYYGMGEKAVELGAQVFDGISLANRPFMAYNPVYLGVNQQILSRLNATWTATPEMLAAAGEVIDSEGVHTAHGQNVKDGASQAAAAVALEKGRVYRIGLLYFSPGPDLEFAVAEFRKELARRGLIEGQNLELKLHHAQADISLIPSIIQNFKMDHLDAVTTMSTPCLAGAAAKLNETPVVFTLVYNPLLTGVGPTATDHRANVTGIASPPPITETFQAIQAFFPNAKRIGTVYCSAELATQSCLDEARPFCKKQGLELIEVSVTASHEVLQATQLLVSRGVDIIWVAGDNTVLTAFEAVAKVANDANIPLINNDPEFVAKGSLLAIGFDSGAAARAMVDPLMRVLTGTSPKDIPFRNVTQQTLTLNCERAKHFGISIPAAYRDRINMYTSLGKSLGHPRKFAFLNMDRTPLLDAAEKAFFKALSDAMLEEGVDYTVRRFNANGDISLLPSLIQAAKESGAEFIATCGTPVLMAALQHARGMPVVFTVASKPERLGLPELPKSMCGIYDDPPVAELLAYAMEHEPNLKRVGTVYDPTQRNVQIAVEMLRTACKEKEVELIELTCSRVSELPDVMKAMVERRPDALLFSSDNLMGTGFPIVAKECIAAKVPIYSTEDPFIGKGLKGAVGYDFQKWGYQSGLKAVRLMVGYSAEEIGQSPLEPSEPMLDEAWQTRIGK